MKNDNDEKLLVLEHKIHYLQQGISSIEAKFKQFDKQMSPLSAFLLNEDKNPKQALIEEIISFFMDELKVQNKMQTIEKQQYDNYIYFNEKITYLTEQIKEIQPTLLDMHRVSQESKANKDINLHIRDEFNDIALKQNDFLDKIISLDKKITQVNKNVGMIQQKLDSKVGVSDIEQIQQQMRQDFVTNISLEDFSQQIQNKYDILLSGKADIREIYQAQDQLKVIESKQFEILNNLVCTHFNILANEKLKIFITQSDFLNYKVDQEKILFKSNQEFNLFCSEINNRIKNLLISNRKLNDSFDELNIYLSNLRMDFQNFQKKTMLANEIQQKFDQQYLEQEELQNELKKLEESLTNLSIKIKILLDECNLDDAKQRNQLQEEEEDNFVFNSKSSKAIEQAEKNQEKPVPLKQYINQINQQIQLKLENLEKKQTEFQFQLFEEQNARSQFKRKEQLDSPKQASFENNLNEPLVSLQKLNEIEKFIQNQIEKNETNFKDIVKKLTEFKQTLIFKVSEKIDELSDIDSKISQKCDKTEIYPLLEQKANRKAFQAIYLGQKQFKKHLNSLIGLLQTFFFTSNNKKVGYLLLFNNSLQENGLSEDKIKELIYSQLCKEQKQLDQIAETNDEEKIQSTRKTISISDEQEKAQFIHDLLKHQPQTNKDRWPGNHSFNLDPLSKSFENSNFQRSYVNQEKKPSNFQEENQNRRLYTQSAHRKKKNLDKNIIFSQLQNKNSKMFNLKKDQ